MEQYVSGRKGDTLEAYKITEDIRKIAAALHEDLRNYGGVSDIEKTLVVSACMLAIKYEEDGIWCIDELTGDQRITDGEKIYNIIEKEIEKSLSEDSAKTMLSVLSCVKELKIINKINSDLWMTPLKGFILCLKVNLVDFCKANNITGDYLGIFYSEFMSYSGSDRQSLGIVLTPAFITDILTQLVGITPDDIVIDPCCGTGSFLVSAMTQMENKGLTSECICDNRLYGFDIQSNMFTVAMTNMIIRGKATEHIKHLNFIGTDSKKIQTECMPTVGLMNPPYSQGKKDIKLTEIYFIKHLLDSLVPGGRAAVIVPASTFTDTAKTNEIRCDIYEHHTLEGVISLNKDTFLEVGTYPVIAVFTAGIPHPANKICKFIDFTDDGYITQSHAGRIYTPMVETQKKKLFSAWFEDDAAPELCIKTKVKNDDEWLYSFYHSNLTIPGAEVFSDVVSRYLTFRLDNTANGRSYLFKDEPRDVRSVIEPARLNSKKWCAFNIEDVFNVAGAKVTENKKKVLIEGGRYPRVTCSAFDNACEGFYSGITQDGDDVTLNPGRCLTVESATSGFVFYQPYDFIANPHVIAMRPKEVKLDQFSGLFFVSCFKHSIRNKYNYGYKCSLFRLKKERILLPVTEHGEIDYGYMRSYIMNLYNEKLMIIYSDMMQEVVACF